MASSSAAIKAPPSAASGTGCHTTAQLCMHPYICIQMMEMEMVVHQLIWSLDSMPTPPSLSHTHTCICSVLSSTPSTASSCPPPPPPPATPYAPACIVIVVQGWAEPSASLCVSRCCLPLCCSRGATAARAFACAAGSTGSARLAPEHCAGAARATHGRRV